MSISLFEKKTDHIECKLCPHRCKLRAGESGKCSIRKCDGDAIFLSNYGELVSISVDPISKKPFYHYLEGTKTFSIGGTGCSLDCKFCENHTISQVSNHPYLKKFNPEDLVRGAIDNCCSSICMTYNEPTISYEYLLDVSEACHNKDLKFILKTNAYVNKEPWTEICKSTDAINIDWKGSKSQYKEVCGDNCYVIEDRIREAYESGVHIEISIPLYQGFLDDIRIFFKCSQFLGSLDKNIPCHLLRVNPAYQFSDHAPTDEMSLRAARQIMLFNMCNVYT